MNENNIEYSIPNHGLSEKEKVKADNELKKLRFEQLKKLTSEQKIYADMISLKYDLIDYLETPIFSEKYLFSEFLKRYVSILNISRRKLADDLVPCNIS